MAPSAHPEGSTHVVQYDPFLIQFVESLYTITKLPKQAQEKLLLVKLEELLVYLVALKGSAFLNTFHPKKTEEADRFIKTMEQHVFHKLSIQELAFLSNMSISTFKRNFEKHFSSSPSKWFQEKRLAQSAYLLKNKGKRASDLYLSMGYENLSSFIQAFKAQYGVTPKQYQSS